MKVKRRNYTDEFKESAVRLVTSEGYTIKEAATSLGISECVLSKWKNKKPSAKIASPASPRSTHELEEEIKRLKKENQRLKLEKEILKKAYSVSLLCRLYGVSRSGYYKRNLCSQSARDVEYKSVIPVVQSVSKESRYSYGTRRISLYLSSLGYSCGRHKARSLMRLAGVSAKQRRKFKVTTTSRHNLPVEPNILSRQFSAPEPDTVYASDITYIRTYEGWLYLAVIIDLCSRRIVGWSFSERIDRKLVLNALQMAIWRRRPSSGLLFHSDRGSQYCSGEFGMYLRENGIKASMSRKGNCWDNAVCESFFGTLKTECVVGNVYRTRLEAKTDIIDYIEMFYNCKRMHSYLGYLSPMKFEERYYNDKKAA